MNSLSEQYIPRTLMKGCVKIFNMDRQEEICTTELIGALEKIPDRHFKGLNAIFYDPNRRFQCNLCLSGYRAVNFKSLGEYDRKIKCVIIYHFKNKTDFISTMYHEIGHHVYHYVLDSKLRKKWATTVYQKGPKQSVNASEDFAEKYADYAINPNKLQFYREKCRFMREFIFF